MQDKRSLESQALNNQKTKSLLDAITSKNVYSMCIQYTFNGYSIYTFNDKQYGGSVRKKLNFECMNKSDILLGEGGGAKLMSFFQDVF